MIVIFMDVNEKEAFFPTRTKNLQMVVLRAIMKEKVAYVRACASGFV